MERKTCENYETNEPTIYRPQQESTANSIGSMVVSFIVFESIFSGMGALGGSSILGSSEAFAHTTAEIAGVNNIASYGNEETSLTNIKNMR